MLQQFRVLKILLITVLFLSSCLLVSERDRTAGSPTPSDKEDPPAEENTENGPADPVDWELPPQSQAAEIRPENLRVELTHLTNLIGFDVLDDNGDLLGVATDYIVNTCETYIIYILMEPVEVLGFPDESLVVIPFEAVTINSGILDVEKKSVQLRLIPEQFDGAPTLSAGVDLTPTDWEEAVRSFWEDRARIGVLQTSCNVPGGPVFKVAYATRLLGVEIYDGQDILLGAVQEAILEPESGKLAFYIVKPAEGEGLVLVSIGVTNIPKEALDPGGELILELLSAPELFWEAPRISGIEEADDVEFQSSMRGYWGG